MKISVFGAGYVGLTTAAGLAEIGHCVCCADNDDVKLNLCSKVGRCRYLSPTSRTWFPADLCDAPPQELHAVLK
jgi:2-polyprenyl-6-methoxyphenol hydroxylase-like FAD-dependent oxidoreductase